MAQYVRVGATSARCPAVPPGTGNTRWEDTVQGYITGELEKLAPQQPDLILFPELCDWPAEMDMEEYLAGAAQLGDEFARYMARQAARLGCWIACPTVRRAETGRLRNACLLFDRQGNLAAVYDKTYLTQGELDLGLEPGQGAVTVDCELGRLGFAICFDLNYIQLAEEYRRRGVDMILFPALFHGGMLRQVWAFTAGAALVAASGGCGAAVLDPTGGIQASSTGYFPRLTADVNLDCALLHLDFNAEKLERMCAEYGPRVRVKDPGGLGAVLVYSEDKQITARDLVEKFELEPREAYLARMAEQNRNSSGQ